MSLQTSIPRKLEALKNLSREDQYIGAAVAVAVIAAVVYTSKSSKKVRHSCFRVYPWTNLADLQTLQNTAPFVSGSTPAGELRSTFKAESNQCHIVNRNLKLAGNVTYAKDPRAWTEYYAKLYGGTFRTDVFPRVNICPWASRSMYEFLIMIRRPVNNRLVPSSEGIKWEKLCWAKISALPALVKTFSMLPTWLVSRIRTNIKVPLLLCQSFWTQIWSIILPESTIR